jgi:hypothetical protein
MAQYLAYLGLLYFKRNERTTTKTSLDIKGLNNVVKLHLRGLYAIQINYAKKFNFDFFVF